MQRLIDANSLLSFHCFLDFVVGHSIRDIGKRHNLAEPEAERLLRRGLYDFGFSEHVLASIDEGTSTARGALVVPGKT